MIMTLKKKFIKNKGITIDKLHFSRIIIISGAILSIISLFLPWYSFSYLFSDYTQSGYDSNGWLALIFLSIVIILSVLGDRESTLPPIIKYINSALFLLATIFGIYKIVNPGSVKSSSFSGMMDTFKNSLFENYGGIEYGLWAFMLFVVATMTFSIFTIFQRD